MKKLLQLFTFSLLLLPTLVSAQEGVYQLSGLIISENGQEPIPFVTVQINHSRRGAIGNAEGFYSIPVSLYDTVYFSHVGYHKSALVVADIFEIIGEKMLPMYMRFTTCWRIR